MSATGMPESSQAQVLLSDLETDRSPGKTITSSEMGRPLGLSLMPTEMLLMIASKLPPSARALLALTSKGFWYTLIRPASTAPKVSNKQPGLGLRMCAELPSNFQEPRMSEPQHFNFERWELLRLLEKDVCKKWLFCFDCFILHPAHAFVKSQTSLVPWSKNYGGLFGSQSKPRTCRQLICPTAPQEAGSFSPSGVVDVCPCLQMTAGKKRRIQAKLCALKQEKRDGGWWHTCRHVYDDIELEMRLGFYAYDDDDGLGIVISYHHRSPSDSSSVTPRMLCPHIHLDTMINTLSQCRDRHSEQVVCTRCKEFQRCKSCLSTVFKFSKETDATSATTSCLIKVERRMDRKLWYEHTVFPFSRQRQDLVMQRRSSWKLW